MPTRNVVITDHQASFVEKLVSAGRYQNVSEVLREGLRLVEERETEHALRRQELHTAVQRGIDDIEAGRFTVLETDEAFEAHFKSLADEAITSGTASDKSLVKA